MDIFFNVDVYPSLSPSMCVLSPKARVGSDSPSLTTAQTPIFTLFATNTISVNKERTLKKKISRAERIPACLLLGWICVVNASGCWLLIDVFFLPNCFIIRFEQLPHLWWLEYPWLEIEVSDKGWPSPLNLTAFLFFLLSCL